MTEILEPGNALNVRILSLDLGSLRKSLLKYNRGVRESCSGLEISAGSYLSAEGAVVLLIQLLWGEAV